MFRIDKHDGAEAEEAELHFVGMPRKGELHVRFGEDVSPPMGGVVAQ